MNGREICARLKSGEKYWIVYSILQPSTGSAAACQRRMGWRQFQFSNGIILLVLVSSGGRASVGESGVCRYSAGCMEASFISSDFGIFCLNEGGVSVFSAGPANIFFDSVGFRKYASKYTRGEDEAAAFELWCACEGIL